MEPMDVLRELYTQHPCRTLPNAFWKTAAKFDASGMVVTRDSDDQPTSLVIWSGTQLLTLWCADPAVHPLKQGEIESIPFALVHQNALPVFKNRHFTVRRPYFRLSFDHQKTKISCPKGFVFERFSPEDDIEAATLMIRACYQHIKVSPEIVTGWTRHSVYDPDLWVWVIDLETGKRAGLGIAERDPRIPEASLEWIQVHPDYRGKGIGKAVVSELLCRVSDRVLFTTVAGELENVHYPEKLYRRCGFSGDDVWWLLSDHG